MPEKVKNQHLTIKELLPWMVLICLLAFLPYLVACIVVPEELIFTGALVNPDDAAIYFAAIRQGMVGNWLFTPNFSPEQWPPILGYLAYLATGQLAGLLGGGLQFWFHLSRLAACIFTLIALIYWVRVALPSRRRIQLSAWLFIVLGGGIGWLLVIIFGYGLISLPDILGPEWSTVTVFLGNPHYIFGLGFEVITLGSAIGIARGARGIKWAILGSIAAMGLAVTYPYAAVVSCLVIGFQMLHLAAREKRIPWSPWLKSALLILPMLLFLLYYGSWMLSNSFYQNTHGSENIVRGPGVIGILVGFGILLPFAVYGGWRWFHRNNILLVPIWALINLVIVLIPTAQAGDFVLGFMVPVATLAAYGLEEVVLPGLKSTRFFHQFGRLSPTPFASLRRVFLILVFPSTLMVSLLVIRSTSLRFQFPTYMPRSEIIAATWLADRIDEEDLVLSYYPIGNYLPRLSSGHVFLGQQFMTPELDQKLSLVQKFWDPATSDKWRQDLLESWEVDFIYQGYFEKNLHNHELKVPGKVIYQKQGVTILQLKDG